MAYDGLFLNRAFPSTKLYYDYIIFWLNFVLNSLISLSVLPAVQYHLWNAYRLRSHWVWKRRKFLSSEFERPFPWDLFNNSNSGNTWYVFNNSEFIVQLTFLKFTLCIFINSSLISKAMYLEEFFNFLYTQLTSSTIFGVFVTILGAHSKQKFYAFAICCPWRRTIFKKIYVYFN